MKNLIDLHDEEIFEMVKHNLITLEEFQNWLEDRLDETWQKAIDCVQD